MILYVIGLLTGLCPGPALPAPSALAQPEPAVGTFLVASRELRGSGFAESVILILQHDADGTMGLIINQPTTVNPAELLPEISGLDRLPGKLHLGGPVEPWGVILLIQSDQALDNAEHIFADVYASGDRMLLQELIESNAFRGNMHLYAGHAGWVAGQLDDEIRRGSWHVMAADEQYVFSPRPGQVWHQLIAIGDRLIVDADDGSKPRADAEQVGGTGIMRARTGHFTESLPEVHGWPVQAGLANHHTFAGKSARE